MINFGEIIYADKKDQMFSEPGEGRFILGRYNTKNGKSIKEGTVFKMSITEKGKRKVEEILKKKKRGQDWSL